MSANERFYSGPPTEAAITAGDLKTRLYIFADDSMRGRAAGTPDNLRGVAYIEREVRRLGLEPAGENGTYFQDVPLFAREVSRRSQIVVDDGRFALGTDFIPRDNGWGARSIDDTVPIYAGSWPDTATMVSPSAVAGKLVIIAVPSGWALDRGYISRRYASAAGLVAASLDSIPPTIRREFLSTASFRLRPDSILPSPNFFFVSRALARTMFGGRAITSLKPGNLGRRVRGNVTFDPEVKPARNVVAVLRGSDERLRGRYIAIGAHNDHDPVEEPVDHDSVRAFNSVARPGGSESPLVEPTKEGWARINALRDSLRRARPPRLDSIMNGADDDGSGSMAMLEIAEALVKSNVKPRRSILFVWHTAEELGLIGSSYFTDHPTVPRDSIVAQLNIDMIGRGGATDIVRTENGQPIFGSPNYVQLIGSRRLSTELGDIVEQVNRRQETPLMLDYARDANGEPHQYYCRSDHYMYARYGIPITFFFDGGHADYHQVSDEPQYIEYPHYARIVQLVHDIAKTLANLDHDIVVDKPKPNPHAPCVQ